jgi:hypothetical protein
MERAFALTPGEQYTALVVLPGKLPGNPCWVSPMVKLKVPEPEIAGVNRPPYGSDRFWDRFLAVAGQAKHGVALETTIETNGNSHVDEQMRFVNGHLIQQIRMKNIAGPRVCARDEVVLIHDSGGRPLLKNAGGRCIWPLAFSEGGENGPLGPLKLTNPYPLGLVYHFRPGESYTALAAANVDHSPNQNKRDGLVVARPLTFSLPDPDSNCGVTSGRELAEKSPASQSASSTPKSAERHWQTLSRFAGKPTDGLLLEASVAASGQLVVTLRNGGAWIIVAKWSGDSGYEILVRDPAGKIIPLAGSRTKSPEDGGILNVVSLGRGEEISARLPVDELFAMKAPGEYTALVSLPVLGDVDAVLTAAPIKIRIGSGPEKKPRTDANERK